VFDPNWNEYDFRDILAQLRPEFSTAKGLTEYISRQSDPKAAFEASFNDAVDRWVSGDFDDQYIETWSVFSSRVRQAFISSLNEHTHFEGSDNKHFITYT